MNSPCSPGQTTTPGPWEVCHDHPDDKSKAAIGYIRAVKRQYESDEIAIVFGCDYEGGKQEANARLIASAPDLLAAAKLGLSIAKSWIHQEMTGTAHADAMRALKPIRAAIARASGEKP